jgi:hypothetical protein
VNASHRARRRDATSLLFLTIMDEELDGMDIEMFSDDSEEDLDRLVPAKISICLLIGLAAPQTRRTASKSSSRRSFSSSAVRQAVNRARALTLRPNPRTRQRPLNAPRLNCGLPTAAVKGALPKLTQKRRYSMYLAAVRFARCASPPNAPMAALARLVRLWVDICPVSNLPPYCGRQRSSSGCWT